MFLPAGSDTELLLCLSGCSGHLQTSESTYPKGPIVTEPTPDPKDTIAAFRHLLRDFDKQTPEVQGLIDDVVRAGGLNKIFRSPGLYNKPQRLEYIGSPTNPESDGIFRSLPDLPLIFDREPDGNSDGSYRPTPKIDEPDWLNHHSGHDSYPGLKDPALGQADASATMDEPSDKAEGED